jgi:putative DNA primase/helicase
MDFLDFARSYGILIHDYPPVGIWKRYPTEDHPRTRNGAVKYLGTHGFVQNHATDTVVSIWQADKEAVIDRSAIRASVAKADDERRKKQFESARRAVRMLNDSGFSSHEYLRAKGFPDEQGNVWHNEGKPYLLIPMRCEGSLVGCQIIDVEGGKKFLYGQRTSGASFVFDNKGMNILCEGYATALSIRMALKQMKQRYTLHVCFSAGNMAKVADGLVDGLVIADNDVSGTGQEVARKIGWKTWMSKEVGDANDYHQKHGLFKLTQSLTQSMLGIRHYGGSKS